ncbi:MAG TPA: amidohydrolase family protein [Candidatus Binatia bacterium]|nr:amidohydrolase family protein [Candidatus Binatia bacterium]
MADYKVIDTDGHVLESMDGLRKLLPARWQRGRLGVGDNWDRNLRGKLGQEPKSPQDQLAALDKDEISLMVMYPTTCLSIGVIREVPFATALTHAYNDWMHEFCRADPNRLKFVALIAPQDIDEAAKELRRAVKDLGAVGATLPTYVPNRPDWSDRYYDPLYAEAQKLDVGVGFHATMLETVGAMRFNNFINVHSVGHPVEQMMSLCSVVVGGVLERFPQLRVAFLESGIGWLPFMMDRLDEEIEKRGEDEAPWLKANPSEYITGGRCFFGVECGEKTIADAVRWGLENALLYASDYPHWDGDWPHTVKKVRERQDLSAGVKQKMLHDNAMRFYKLAIA